MHLCELCAEGMKITVIVVNFNGRQHLVHCLAALQSQSRKADQIIVVDNGSTDGSAEFVRCSYPWVEFLPLEHNLGFAGGNTAGLERACGDYIVLLNNDTKPHPDWLQNLCNCAERLPDVGIVASHMTNWHGTHTDTAGDGCSVTGRGYKLHQGQSTRIPIESRYVFSACAGAALYKRAMLEEVGFLEESFFMNGEDTDLAFRARLAGWKAYLCAEAIVRHRVGGSQRLYSRRHIYYATRNHIWLFVRCMPTRLLIKYLPSLLLQVLIYLVAAARHRQPRAYLEGLYAAAAGLPRTLRQRRSIQKLQRIPVEEIEKELTPFGAFLQLKRRGSQAATGRR